jgi:hypothetical protein
MDPAYSTPAGRPEPPTPVFAARALPAKPGDYLVWNQCVMHLGRPDERVRRASAHAHGTRVSARRRSTHHEAVPARGTFPGPAALAGAEAHSGFDICLQLVARQILQYQHMYGLSQSLADLATYLLTAPTRDA